MMIRSSPPTKFGIVGAPFAWVSQHGVGLVDANRIILVPCIASLQAVGVKLADQFPVMFPDPRGVSPRGDTQPPGMIGAVRQKNLADEKADRGMQLGRTDMELAGVLFHAGGIRRQIGQFHDKRQFLGQRVPGIGPGFAVLRPAVELQNCKQVSAGNVLTRRQT